MIAEPRAAIGCESLLRKAAGTLRQAGVESPRREARLLLAYACGVDGETLISCTRAITEYDAEKFGALIKHRAMREPLAYITGSREFWSLQFRVGAGVLIPRPESETLIEAALAKFPQQDAKVRVLDLGTGSGCLLLGFLKERPQASGVGIDASEMALSFA